MNLKVGPKSHLHIDKNNLRGNITFKAGLYIIWCGVYTLGDRHSASVNPSGQLGL